MNVSLPNGESHRLSQVPDGGPVQGRRLGVPPAGLPGDTPVAGVPALPSLRTAGDGLRLAVRLAPVAEVPAGVADMGAELAAETGPDAAGGAAGREIRRMPATIGEPGCALGPPDHPDESRLERRRLVEAEPDPGPLCLALCTDALGRPVVATGGDRGLNWYTGGDPAAEERDPAAGWLPPSDGGPRDVRELALARDARGDLVAAVVDGGDRLWTADRNSGWTMSAGHARGLAALVSARGEILLWTARPEAVVRVRLSSDGSPPIQEEIPAVPGSRVPAAAWDADGRAAVLVAEPDRVTHCTWPAVPGALPEWTTVRAGAAVRGTIELNRGSGELEAGLLAADGTRYGLTRHRPGEPWKETEVSRQPEWTHTALRGIRQGVARATAGPHGVSVVTETGAKTREYTLRTGPARLVGLHAGADGNLHVAALADGKVRCWSETWAENWMPVGLWEG